MKSYLFPHRNSLPISNTKTSVNSIESESLISHTFSFIKLTFSHGLRKGPGYHLIMHFNKSTRPKFKCSLKKKKTNPTPVSRFDAKITLQIRIIFNQWKYAFLNLQAGKTIIFFSRSSSILWLKEHSMMGAGNIIPVPLFCSAEDTVKENGEN